MTRPVRLTRDENRAQTRERLLDAARHAFARGGYGGASIDTIAADAGYSKGAFYSNFASKEQVFLDLLARHMTAEAAQLKGLVEAERSVEMILDSIDLWLQKMHSDADWALLAMELQLQARRSPSFASQYDALYADHRDRLANLIARLFALSGKRPPASPLDLAAAMIALATGLVLQRIRSPDSGDPAGALLKKVLHSLLRSSETL